MRIRDTGWRKFGSGMEKIRIRDKHPRFLTQEATGTVSVTMCIAAGKKTARWRGGDSGNQWAELRGRVQILAAWHQQVHFPRDGGDAALQGETIPVLTSWGRHSI
jgi:hypothetical protein